MKEKTMNRITARALRDLAALWTAAALAASAWAGGIHEDGYILDAPDWRSEVARVPSPDWPVDGWYRVAPGRKAVDVRAMKPSEADGTDPDGALYVRVPGVRMTEGACAKVRFASNVLRPQVGHEYQLALGDMRFSFVVHSDRDGTRYDIAYGGAMHSYMLGLPAAATRVHAIADLDGDRRPDFLVEVGDETYLLLSTQAQPGGNLPSAQLWAVGS
jgi:hypothetical protein